MSLLNSKCLIVFYILSCFLVVNITYGSTDTSYSETKVIPKDKNKDKEVTKKDKVAHKKTSDDDSEENDDCFICECVKIDDDADFKETILSILFLPFKAMFCATIEGIVTGIYKSNKSLILSSPFLTGYSENHLRFGVSFGVGLLNYYKQSLGFQYKFETSLQLIKFKHLIVRGTFGFFGSFNNPIANYQRSVYVNNSFIGVQTDISLKYYNYQIPFLTEILLLPKGQDGSLYLTFGAGPCYIWEKMELERKNSYSNTIENIDIIEKKWVPIFSFGVGRIVELGNIFGNYEIKMNGIIYNKEKLKSLPSHNIKGSLAVSMNWGLIF